ncbi:hypothetical protein KJ365_04035 [Glaciecola sp. XM2]|uniref:hypothetical protein n=1 Tax=Glaciecola sp. XM2 TaxID=1914931 RepID=UPI001BDF1FC3|nr:hypothetical protein [Glaciecola sp. XM2]MBT1450038.1 hypothetical protein [Glaciecola sp. XM2]
MSGTTSPESYKPAESSEGKTFVLIAWGLLLGGWVLMPFAPIAGLIVSYLQMDKYSYVERSHFKRVIGTFWLSVWGWVLCILLYITIAGIIIAIPLGIAISIFVTYRGIKGLIRASESLPYI